MESKLKRNVCFVGVRMKFSAEFAQQLKQTLDLEEILGPIESHRFDYDAVGVVEKIVELCPVLVYVYAMKPDLLVAYEFVSKLYESVDRKLTDVVALIEEPEEVESPETLLVANLIDDELESLRKPLRN